MADPTFFQTTIGTTAVTGGAITALTAIVGPVVKSFVKLNSSGSGVLVYSNATMTTTTAGMVVPNSVPITIDAGQISSNLANLYLIASVTNQTVSGVVV